jgi:hypothetical protein
VITARKIAESRSGRTYCQCFGSEAATRFLVLLEVSKASILKPRFDLRHRARRAGGSSRVSVSSSCSGTG